MLTIATTREFRKTVRNVLKNNNIPTYASWTNNSGNRHARRRTIGFQFGYCTLDTLKQQASLIEQMLAEQGLRADTRVTQTHGWMYIRGTCVIKKVFGCKRS